LEPKKASNASLKDAGIENFRFHDLRHTAGTRLAEAGADAFTIKDILGLFNVNYISRRRQLEFPFHLIKLSASPR
jgi:hypothetical protein